MSTTTRNPGQAIFDRWAPSYDRTVLQRIVFEPIHDAVLDAVRAIGARPCDLLDVGCGTGRLLANVAGRWDGVRLTGIDASAEMIAAACRQHEGDARFAFQHGDASALPLPSESFDVVTSTMSFHHWRDQTGGIREVARVLRPGGVFVLADIDMPSLLRPLFKWTDQASFQGPASVQRLLEQAQLSLVSQRRFWPLVRTRIFVAKKL
jgi:ubiquinone/menaquinone biosynthesis C-methylase UbiE